MKEPQGARNTEHRQDQFHTPRRPNQQLPATARVTENNRSPEPTLASNRKRALVPRAQSTLTQIDFVTQPTASNDEQLEYIHEQGRGNTHTTEISRANDDTDRDSNYLPPPPTRPTRMTKMKAKDQEYGSSERPPKRRNSAFGDQDTDRGHRPRKSETPRPTGRSKGIRKSLEKSTTKRDKTLTQMDFVRRYITIADDDDDVNMGYIQPTPHKNNVKSEQKTPLPSLSNLQHAKRTTPTKRNRRAFEEELDLSTGDPIPQPMNSHGAESQAQRTPKAPVTPQKSRMREIPSSQTPESPGIAIITSSQFRSATHSPSKTKPSKPTETSVPSIKQESQQNRRAEEDSQDFENIPLVWGTTTHLPDMPDYLNMPPPNNTEHFSSSAPQPDVDSQELPGVTNQISRKKRERTVVYETDADSDYDEPEESHSRSSVTPSPKKPHQVIHEQAGSHATQTENASPKDDSPDLPLPAAPSSPNWGDAPPSEPPMSDASVCYQRMHAATQFPHEPIPALNTQRMAELFPSEGNTQIPRPGPSKPVQNQTGPFSQSQSQSQGAKDPTEMVPESSPIRENENEADDTTFQRPKAPQSVVQVESSQAVDRDGQWRGQVLSRSQVLTSSVMESIPMPNFWMGSQDSVGEPYSLPEG
ncbi:hypothetical protein N7541_001770 [Penicillium brevicompactum]|uniref:Uncharacterized protein n=1 Tax=Penicillium brevicompactum TaxID=5074 RepID=A0A9W9RYR5_PENBR|nr:hypothetical protein N7541_001770 [Penicillium brevicompactum]